MSVTSRHVVWEVANSDINCDVKNSQALSTSTQSYSSSLYSCSYSNFARELFFCQQLSAMVCSLYPTSLPRSFESENLDGAAPWTALERRSGNEDG